MYVLVYTLDEGTRTRAEGPFSEAEAFARRNELYDVDGACSVEMIEHVDGQDLLAFER